MIKNWSIKKKDFANGQMDIIYYKVLELGRECSQEDIAESYRRLSLKNHPKLSKGENAAKSEYNFQKLGEHMKFLVI